MESLRCRQSFPKKSVELRMPERSGTTHDAVREKAYQFGPGPRMPVRSETSVPMRSVPTHANTDRDYAASAVRAHTCRMPKMSVAVQKVRCRTERSGTTRDNAVCDHDHSDRRGPGPLMLMHMTPHYDAAQDHAF